MASELKQVMTLIDNNSNNIKEGDYLQICNLLMTVHKSFVTPEPPMILPSYTATLPLPSVNVPFTPDMNLGLNRVPTQRRLDFSGFTTPEPDPITRTEFQIYIDDRIRFIRNIKWKRMSDKRKIEALNYYYHFPEQNEPRLSDMENSIGLSPQELSRIYREYMTTINDDYDNTIQCLIETRNTYS